ncbi:chitooligosaccharidolytic beta-N-acetylglucosaminidase isoform X2 [Prorops nasuta]|uniref:chitooligosaccharidolytic beta-N-acetylglucosaminidase isoform X2 n=1 Tax=Prorops nasuta TaxID=863751 RepID=UPI0034CE14B3
MYLGVHPDQFEFDLKDLPETIVPFVSTTTDSFMKNIRQLCGENCTRTEIFVYIHIIVKSTNLDLNWDTKEDYSLALTTRDREVRVHIASTTVFGARHALETLSQLTAPIVTSETSFGLVMLDSAAIKDSPVFPHRGLLIDTARNYLPVDDILRTINGLASVKMNVLHWHATDSQSFPLEIRREPNMTRYGSYSPDQIYTVDDMRRIVFYGKSQGVRVLLELDSPSHAGAGWEWGEESDLGKLAVCVSQQPWRDYCIQPPCGQLNPVNENTYVVLGEIYAEVLSIWGREAVLHLGGDEVFFNCWNSSSEIVEKMTEDGMGRKTEDFLKLWAQFHTRQLNQLDKVRGILNVKVILWSSYLTSPEFIESYLDKNRYVIQTWVESDSPIPSQLLNLGYKLIMSTKNTWYLDHGFWGRTKYHTWRDAYNNKIPTSNLVLGGEACMWGEYLNGGSLDSRVWPRTAAVAERLWSNPANINTEEVEPRLQAQGERLESRMIFPEAIAPEWCSQHERQCS